jgi:hypothetical protein
LITLIGKLAWTGSSSRPYANAAVLLAHAHFILIPELKNRAQFEPFGFKRRFYRIAEFFLKSSIASGACLG